MKFWKTNRRRFIVSAILLSPGLAVADALWLEPHWIKTRTLRLSKEKPTHRIVHFTDLHHKGDRAYLEKIICKINALSPDLVCFTGDLIEDNRYLPETLEFLAKIKSPMYGVPGNHDYWADADFGAIAKCFSSTGGAWLMNGQTTTADGKLHITGASCSRWKLRAGMQFLPPKAGDKNIMLIHYPMFCESLAPHRYDLLLAGHSHGGQIRIPFYGSVIEPSGTGKYDMGFFQTPAGPMYVNPGLGWFYTPLRFNCRPEITVFEV
jgi:predicted MPP superfamily phosphohydrolase